MIMRKTAKSSGLKLPKSLTIRALNKGVATQNVKIPKATSKRPKPRTTRI